MKPKPNPLVDHATLSSVAAAAKLIRSRNQKPDLESIYAILKGVPGIETVTVELAIAELQSRSDSNEG